MDHEDPQSSDLSEPHFVVQQIPEGSDLLWIILPQKDQKRFRKAEADYRMKPSSLMCFEMREAVNLRRDRVLKRTVDSCLHSLLILETKS